MKKKNSYCINESCISYANRIEIFPGAFRDDSDSNQYLFYHYGILQQIFAMFKEEGFTVEESVQVDEGIQRNFFVGKKGDFEFYAEQYPAGFEITFFQSFKHKNPYGGRYDSDLLQKMSYLSKLQFRKYSRKIVDLINTLEDLDDTTKKSPKLAEEWIKEQYVRDHKYPDTNFNLSDLDGKELPFYRAQDRDGRKLRNGDIKYFRDFNGYLCRGRIYHDINNIWWVITDRYTVRRVVSFELFDLTPKDSRKREKAPRLPKEYQECMKAIKKTATRELINELRRRGMKVNYCTVKNGKESQYDILHK